MMGCGCTKPRILTIMVVLLALSLLGLITTMATLGGELYIFLPLAIFIIVSSGTILFANVELKWAVQYINPDLFKSLLLHGSCLVFVGMIFFLSNALLIVIVTVVPNVVIIVMLGRLPAIQKTKENLFTLLGIALYCLDLISDEYVALELMWSCDYLLGSAVLALVFLPNVVNGVTGMIQMKDKPVLVRIAFGTNVFLREQYQTLYNGWKSVIDGPKYEIFYGEPESNMKNFKTNKFDEILCESSPQTIVTTKRCRCIYKISS